MRIHRSLIWSMVATTVFGASAIQAASFDLSVVSSPADPAATTTTINGLSLTPGSRSISDDGRYAVFTSRGSNLPGGASEFAQVYLYDEQTGAISLVSRAADGGPRESDSYSPVISGNGLHIAYTLGIAEGSSEVAQIQIVNRVTGSTELLTELIGRAPNSLSSSQPVLSAEGRFIAFVSDTADLVSGDTNDIADLFVLDQQSSEITRVSVGAGGVQLTEQVDNAAISNDGEVVSFVTTSPLVDDDSNLAPDVYVHLRSTGQTFRLDTAPAGSDEPAQPVRSALMSDNGQYFVYVDDSPVMFEGNLIATRRVMRYDRLNGELRHAAVVEPDTQDINEILAGSDSPSVSADGRFVSFLSANVDGRVGIRDFQLDTLVLPLAADVLEPVRGRSVTSYTLSGDGSAAMLRTALGPRFLGLPTAPQFLHYRIATGTLSTLEGAPVPVAVAEGENTLSSNSSVSADGRFVVFSTRSASFSDSDSFQQHIVLADTVNRSRVLLSAGQSRPDGSAVSLRAAISASGSHVVFESTATRFSAMVEAADDDDGATDLFVFELASGVITHASASNPALLLSSRSFSSPELSANGRYLTFATSNGFAGDNFFTPSVFRQDLKTGDIVLVSKTESGLRNDGFADRPRISADGHTIAFLTNSPRLLGQGSNNPLHPIFVWSSDGDGTRQLRSAAPTQHFSPSIALSGNGRFVAYAVRASLDPAEQYDELYLHDLATDTTELVERAELVFVGTRTEFDLPVLSHDGRYVGFRETRHIPVLAALGRAPSSLARRDRFTGERVELVGELSAAAVLSDQPGGAAMSADGTTIAFESDLALIDYDPDASSDVFIALQRETGGSIVSAVLPSSRSAGVGATSTAYGTLIASADLTGCTVELAGDTAIDFSWQPIDSATGAPSGEADVAIDLPANTPVPLLFSLSAATPVAPQELVFDAWCANGQATNVVMGLNTLEFSASSTAPADVVAIAAGPANDGTLALPLDGEYAFFSMATINIGAAATIQAVPNVLGVDAAAAVICQTNSATGACLADPAATVSVQMAAGDTPTFAVFVRATEEVVFHPARSRVQVVFVDGEGVNRGRTSLALR